MKTLPLSFKTLGFAVLFCLNNLCAQAPKLFITLISHNEDNIGYNNSSTLYYNNRAALVNICNILQTKGVKYNYGSDYVALQAIASLDTGNVVSNTNGKNLVKWMKEDKGVECDPHAHETSYNYADVHYLMSQLGITPSDVMSGYLYDTLQNGVSWDSYQNGVTGINYSFHTWNPKILWGAATPMHVADPYFFGVFKPQSISNYFTHAPANNLTAIGVGCKLKLENTTTIAYVDSIIDNIVANIQSGALPSNGIYTQEIFFGEGKVNQPWFLPLLNKVIDSVNLHVLNGTVEWKNLTEIYNYWKATNDSVPFAYDCNGTNVLGVPGFEQQASFSVYPNPLSTHATVQTQNTLVNAEISIYNSLGISVKRFRNISGQSVNLQVDDLPGGVYLVQIKDQGKIFNSQKLIVTD